MPLHRFAFRNWRQNGENMHGSDIAGIIRQLGRELERASPLRNHETQTAKVERFLTS